jgi:hypothetical protein
MAFLIRIATGFWKVGMCVLTACSVKHCGWLLASVGGGGDTLNRFISFLSLTTSSLPYSAGVGTLQKPLAKRAGLLLRQFRTHPAFRVTRVLTQPQPCVHEDFQV